MKHPFEEMHIAKTKEMPSSVLANPYIYLIKPSSLTLPHFTSLVLYPANALILPAKKPFSVSQNGSQSTS